MANENNYDATSAALISAGVETANMVSASGNSRKARNHASEENQKARDWNLDMWNKNNAWNEHVSDPAYKMKRLKDANINPHLAYSNGSDFANPTSGAPAQGVAPMTPSVPHAYNINSAPMLQSMMMNAQIRNINADTQQKITNTEHTQIIAGMDSKTLENMAISIPQENEIRGLNIESGKLNLSLTQEKVNQTKQEIVNLISKDKEINATVSEIASRKALNDQQKANLISQIAVIKATADNIKANTSLTNENIQSANRANKIGERFDESNAYNENAQSRSATGTAIQMYLKAKGMTPLEISGKELENVLKQVDIATGSLNTATTTIQRGQGLLNSYRQDIRSGDRHRERNHTMRSTTTTRDARGNRTGSRTTNTRRR